MKVESLLHWCTPRVELFLLEPAHVTDDYVSWLADRDVVRYLESRFTTYDKAATVAFVAGVLNDPKSLMLGIRSNHLNRHVGNIKLGPIDRNHGLGEIGLIVGDRAAWGRGIATDAISLMFQIATQQLGLRKVTAGCYASNRGSVRAFEKAGFHIEAIRKNHFLLDGRGEDALLMARFCD